MLPLNIGVLFCVHLFREKTTFMITEKMHTTNKYLSRTCWLLQADGVILSLISTSGEKFPSGIQR